MNYDLSEIDSVEFIGFTDAVGNSKANLRLSKRRAKNTYKFCKRVFDKEKKIFIDAKGEGTKDDPSLNRRVDVIFHHKDREQKVEEILIKNADPRCFFIDFVALQKCNLRIITKKREEYAHIEALAESRLDDTKHYYVKKDLSGNTTIKQLRWGRKTTGKLWWKKKRLVATLPKESFDRFQFFTLTDGPCDGCKEEVLTKDTIIMTIRKYYPDVFLMSNMQAKIRFFSKGKMKIRVPREYVDNSDTYYYGFNKYDSSPNARLDWVTKRAKRKQHYYFSEVLIEGGRIPYIKKSRLTTKCVNSWERELDDGTNDFWRCGYRYNPPVFGVQVNVEPGLVYHNDSIVGFLAAGLSHTSDPFYISLLGGINTHLGFFGMGKFQFHFSHFPLKALSPLSKWQAPSFETISNYGRLYLGTQVQTSYNKKYQSFLEGSVHLGLGFLNAKNKSLVPRIYAQGGISKDFINRINKKPYASFQVGMTLNIGSLFLN